MSKKNDDSIERIFRKAVTQYEPTFVESDWLKMEKMLNEEASRRAAVRSKRIRGVSYAITGLMGLVIAVYFLALNNPSDPVGRSNPLAPELQAEEKRENDGNVQNETSSSGLLSSPSLAISKDSADSQIAGETSQFGNSKDAAQRGAEKSGVSQKGEHVVNKGLDASVRPAEAAVDEKYEVTKPDPLKPHERSEKQLLQGSTSAAGPKAINDQRDLLHTYLADSANAQLSTESGASSENLPKHPVSSIPSNSRIEDRPGDLSIAREEGQVPISSSEIQSAVVHPDSTTSSLPHHVSTGDIATQSVSAAVEQQHDSTYNEDAQKTNTSRAVDSSGQTSAAGNNPLFRWSVGVLFAPEFSTTRLNHYSSPGESLGLRIGYRFSNRFSINTGIIRSTKKYKDDAGEYNTNPNYWKNRTNGVIPVEIKGRCLVVEVPLDIQFDAIQGRKSRLFASAGISSYFMLSQSYNYQFDTPNPGADNGWRTSESESYWFGVGMISAGYEREIHPALMIGIEPYLKVALTEVGWPNINLLSTGAYVTLRYKFLGRGNGFF
jgi:hypothetical protein